MKKTNFMRNRILAIGLTLCLTTSLASCASNNDGSFDNVVRPISQDNNKGSQYTSVATTYPSKHAWGDQLNGTYNNPIIPADYSDPDVIRVGSNYYMVASDFHFMGMQILTSNDMVNWKILTQLYSRLDYEGWDDMKHYGGGSWAPSIRYHDGKFWVYFCTPDEGLFMTTATNAAGPWEPLTLVKAVSGWEDPCPFWDEDGTAYLGHSKLGAGPIILHKMSADGKTLLDDGQTIYTGDVAEGTKFYKKDGYYYLCIPEGGVGTGWQTCCRATNIYGPYQSRRVLEQGTTNVNGPHQGALVDTPEGEWWFYHFQDKSPLGRILHLEPVVWVDGWPVIGDDADGDSIGQPVSTYSKPNCPEPTVADSIQISDDFNSSSLAPCWQWNHNPADDAWSLSENEGSLTTHALISSSFKEARNTLTQKLMGYRSRVEVVLGLTEMKPYQRAGLACMGATNHQIGIGVTPSGQIKIYEEADGKILKAIDWEGSEIRLVLYCDANSNEFHFAYFDENEKEQSVTSESFSMSNGNWKGARYALYNYNLKNAEGEAIFKSFSWIDLDGQPVDTGIRAITK